MRKSNPTPGYADGTRQCFRCSNSTECCFIGGRHAVAVMRCSCLFSKMPHFHRICRIQGESCWYSPGETHQGRKVTEACPAVIHAAHAAVRTELCQ